MATNPLYRKQIGDGIFFNAVTDPKFKHNFIAIHALLPLAEETTAANALLPMLIKKGPKTLPAGQNIYMLLNHLYGAHFYDSATAYNRYQHLMVGMKVLDNRYAMKGENLAHEATKLLVDSFFTPDFTRDFAVEQQNLLDAIAAEINDKRQYAVRRMRQEMFRGEGIAISPLGSADTVAKATSRQVQQAWEELLQTSPLEILFVGSGDPAPAIALLEQAFAGYNRKTTPLSLLRIGETATMVSHVEEALPGIQQGKLVMGFRSRALANEQTKSAARVFAALYGGTPFSKLFLNVRERLSLCYYCAAQMDITNGFLQVDSGVNTENMERAQEEILAQLTEVQKGNISAEEIEQTKMLLSNAIRNTKDSLSGLSGWYLAQVLQGKQNTPEQDIEALMNVTKEEIMSIASGVSLDTVYLLKGAN